MAYERTVHLDQVSGILRDTFELMDADQGHFHGGSFRRVFRPRSARTVAGEGIYVQAWSGRADAVRPTTNALAPYPDANAPRTQEFRIRWDERTPANNDFTLLQGTVKVTVFQLANAGKGLAFDYVKKLVDDAQKQVDEQQAVLRNLDRTAKLGNVNGQAKQNDDFTYANASSTPTNTTGARFLVDDGSIAYFHENQVLDIWDAANSTYTARNVIVRSIETDEKSIGVVFNTDSTRGPLSTGDLSNIADNDELYLSTAKDQGVYSVGAYLEDPTSGESFIGGIDRSTDDYFYMRPSNSRRGESSTPLTKRHINDHMRRLRYQKDQDRTLVLHCSLEMDDHLRETYEDKQFIYIDATRARERRFYNEGTLTGTIVHPSGNINVMPDPLCPINRVELLDLETWGTYTYSAGGNNGVYIMPGNYMGEWNRLNDTSGKPGKELEMQFHKVMVDWCSRPSDNGRILNVTSGSVT